MSIQNNFPAIRPSLLLDFAKAQVLDPRVTFTRASTGTYYGTQIAKAEQNLLLQSQDFTTSWDLSNGVTAASNTAVAPDGTTTADTLAETATTGIHTAVQGPSTSGVITMSVFAKPDSGTPFMTIGFSRDTSNYCSATFNLGLGTNTQTQAVGNYSGASATITLVSQGFYRCTLTVITDTVSNVRVGLNNTGIPTANNRGFGVAYLGVVTNSIFVWGAQLEQRSAVTAYTATTTRAVTNYIPVLQTAAANVPRFDFNPLTDECNGLLIEEQRTNVLLYSDLSLNTYTDGVTVTTNSIVSPDGTVNATLLTSTVTGGSNTCYADRGATATTSTTYSYSVFLKAGTCPVSAINLWFNGGTFRQAIGTITWATLVYSVTSTDSTATGTITNVGNGWYRLTLTYDSGNNTNLVSRVYVRGQASGNVAGETVYAWGRQTEAGAFPTSYIPTVASQVTRAADSASMTGTNFSSWYNQAEGTIYSEYSLSGTSSKPVFVSRATASAGDRLQHSTSASTSIVNSTIQADIGSGTNITSGKQAFAYKLNDFAVIIRGLPVSTGVGTDTSGTVPVVNYATIGYFDFGGADRLNGTIKKIAYYPIRCTNAQLQGLTS